MARKPIHDDLAEHEPQPARMTVQIANALQTGAPLSMDDLACARDHYRMLADMLLVSGPLFASMRSEAVKRHNQAVQRIREDRERERARAQAERDADLVEIA